MAHRRRYLSGVELVDMLARQVRRTTGRPDCAGIVAATIWALEAVGVDVDGLVKADVDEADVVTYPEPQSSPRGRSLAARLAANQPRIELH